MNSPIYSYTSNPHAVSRMGTVHYSRNNGNYSSVPMMPMYAGPGWQKFWTGARKIGAGFREKWQDLSDEEKAAILAGGAEVGQQALDNRRGGSSTSSSGSSTSSTQDPKQQYFTTSTGKSQPSIRAGVTVGRYTPTKGIPTKSGSGIQIGQRGPVGMRRPAVAEDTLLEKISKNRFNIVLASSALLLGVILINRRRQQ